MDPSHQEKIQELKREAVREDINLVVSRAVADLLRAAAVREWGEGATVTIVVKQGDMEEAI